MSARNNGDRPECFISVDIETAGPVPAKYAILSIGACLVEDPEQTFYVELMPEHTAGDLGGAGGDRAVDRGR